MPKTQGEVYVTEIKERYETLYGTTAHGARQRAFNEFNRALSDLADQTVPRQEWWSTEDTERVSRDCTVIIAAAWMLDEACQRVRLLELIERRELPDDSDSMWGIWPDE
jgi:hypothetical protein